MVDLTPAQMQETANRLRHRLEVSGGTYGDRSDLRTGIEAIETLSTARLMAGAIALEVSTRGEAAGFVMVSADNLYKLCELIIGDPHSHRRHQRGGGAMKTRAGTKFVTVCSYFRPPYRL